MCSWTSTQSSLLSKILDDVVCSEEMIHHRRDYCRILDSITSASNAPHTLNFYYTGSKAEGLDLPGSDDDCMFDINNLIDVQVFQTEQDTLNARRRYSFVLSTENVPPCFVMLRSVKEVIDTRSLLFFSRIFYACKVIGKTLYLSSDLYVQNLASEYGKLTQRKISIQGPSMETWTPYMTTSESGTDNVPSIHCSFWPDAATEWRTRQRKFAWPNARDIKSIIEFGCHLVPIGHPKSNTNMFEWRISFSVAERTLVWSFNHVQMQCYAVIKLILKEFINVQCSPRSRVLCSYFIKTLLFWEFEEIDPSYWRKENLRECILFLLCRLCSCVRRGSLKHFFISDFNLLSLKLTDQAQKELLNVFYIILQLDIRIIKECGTLNNVWVQLMTFDPEKSVQHEERNVLLTNEECLMKTIEILQFEIQKWHKHELSNLFTSLHLLVSRYNHSALVMFAIRISLTYACISLSGIPSQSFGNKIMYMQYRFMESNISGIDISTCRLWYAIFMIKSGDYLLSLRVVSDMLSSISPLSLYYNGCGLRHISDETKRRYIDNFIRNSTSVLERARKTWLFDPLHINNVPAAIQVELIHCDREMGVFLSPFVCAYYLMFLCYNGLRQNGNRDCALSKLIDTVNNTEQRGFTRTT